jgi:hypothetical protein
LNRFFDPRFDNQDWVLNGEDFPNVVALVKDMFLNRQWFLVKIAPLEMGVKQNGLPIIHGDVQ